MNEYYSVAEVETATANLALKYPALAELVVLPHITAEGRSSRALRLGGAGAGARNRPALMVIAGVHGAERGSCEIVLNLATDLLAAYDEKAGLSYDGKAFAKAEIEALLDTLDIVIFPLVNPDGRHCSQTMLGREMWRKNRNPDYSNDDPEAVGVDINRNFDFLFDLASFNPVAGVSAATIQTDGSYHGPKAFSEAETRNVRWLLDKFPQTQWFVDIHSPGQCIRYVWGDDEPQHDATKQMNFINSSFDGQRGLPSDAYGEFMPAADLPVLKGLAQRFAADVQAVGGTQYTVGPAYTLTPFSGTSHDYAYSRHLSAPRQHGKVFGFFVEWGDLTCQPDWLVMQKIMGEVSAGLIGFCLAAVGPPGES